MVQDFVTALQFLTRLQLVKESEWSPEKFASSVPYFPLVGAVIGVILAGVYYLLVPFLPPTVLAAFLIAIEIALTGGLHGDGLMDTADGMFSGRSRERILDIMKDSRVGANGVMAFCLFVLLKWSILIEIKAPVLTAALVLMPIISRFAMVAGITLFPYARMEGMGKAFSQCPPAKTLAVAGLFTVMTVAPFGLTGWVSLGLTGLFVILFGRYVTSILGGLTGDVYGAMTEISGVIVLAAYLVW